MAETLEGNLLIAQGGGPTAVINASLQGVVEEAKKYPQIKGIYGARFGVEGLLKEDFIDLRKESEPYIRRLSYSPASALGSCRKKLNEKEFPEVVRILKDYGIRYFFYNGGNDSMDTCNKISHITGEYGYDLKVIGVPKTMDNDLAVTDHCPGFGSAARYAAVSTMELAMDVASLPIHVCILELMGRNAGWLTASAALAKKENDMGPHLIYLPERPFVEEEFLEDVAALHEDVGGVLVVVSEGLKDSRGNSLADSGIVDGFGHKVAGGVGQHLAEVIISKLGIKSRSEKPGLLGRASIAMQSETDRKEAYGAGAFAVKSAAEGKSGYMVSIRRISSAPYQAEFELVPLEKVANAEKTFPTKWINKRGNGIEKEFADYCLPLIGAPLPDYVSLEKVPIKKSRKVVQESIVKEIFVNLKRFDVPEHLGGICPSDDPGKWIGHVMDESEKYGLGKLDGIQVTYLLPESLIISAKERLSKYPDSETAAISIGCQSVFREDVVPGGNFGAFTTNRPAAVAKALGCTWAMIGHSEERKDKQQLMGYCCSDTGKVKEATDSVLNMEAHRALEQGMGVLFCVGETAEEKGMEGEEEQRARVRHVLKGQIFRGLSGIEPYIGKSKLVIGYEPIWAIGPGKTPPGKEYISFVSAYIKDVVREYLGFDIPVVYGGGLKEKNAPMIASVDTIDGGLIALTTFAVPPAFEPEKLKNIIDAYK